MFEDSTILGNSPLASYLISFGWTPGSKHIFL